MLGAFRGNGAHYRSANTETIWALNDASFSVQHGEILGIIGRNGAGKSTLLKILSRITEPNRGYAQMYGRVGSLLEVGTGFHPELTGRENIYLNGAIMGMSRAEIKSKFDDIVSFAEVAQFIDTPVKHYSSGMYLRLAFAVAAHLEPEILLVDEVLAVGDAAFQKKCLGKMAEVSSEGRTVLLVSHNMAAIHALAKRCLLLTCGRLVHDGSAAECITRYMNNFEEPEAETSRRHGYIRLTYPSAKCWDASREFHLEWEVTLDAAAPSAIIWWIVTDSSGTRMLQEYNTFTDLCRRECGTKVWRIRLSIPAVWFKPGMYAVQLRVLPHGLGKIRYHSDALPFEITSSRKDFSEGVLAPDVHWQVENGSAQESDGLLI